MQENSKRTITTNKKAFHEYLIFDKYQAGIVLTGTEIKSIRLGNINLKDSFVKIEDGEVFLYNCHIGLYDKGNRFNHEEKRTRKLLLNKKEILKIFGKVKQDNYTIVPTSMFFVGSLAKIEIALAKGKKLHDKRESIKKRELERDIKKLK
ncbi:MAG: SsrA-binding protein SmpB [Cyanobacteria bacterium SIG30]|nr:SsrA-binding protein SmpB [Cyanobacteria bacterium SIG30]